MGFLSPGPAVGAQSAGLAGAWQPPPQEGRGRARGAPPRAAGQLLPPQPQMAPESQLHERGSAQHSCGSGQPPTARQLSARDWLQTVLRLAPDAPVVTPCPRPPRRRGCLVSLPRSRRHTSHCLAQPPEKCSEATQSPDQYSSPPLWPPLCAEGGAPGRSGGHTQAVAMGTVARRTQTATSAPAPGACGQEGFPWQQAPELGAPPHPRLGAGPAGLGAGPAGLGAGPAGLGAGPALPFRKDVLCLACVLA